MSRAPLYLKVRLSWRRRLALLWWGGVHILLRRTATGAVVEDVRIGPVDDEPDRATAMRESLRA